MEIIGLLIAGVIVGLLGKFVAPKSRDQIPIWLTIICGVVGVLLGSWVAGMLGVGATPGIDWIRWIISIVLAAVLVMVAAGLMARRGRGGGGVAAGQGPDTAH